MGIRARASQSVKVRITTPTLEVVGSNPVSRTKKTARFQKKRAVFLVVYG